jgi:ABC-type uncharacterized transport system ATPase subunit
MKNNKNDILLRVKDITKRFPGVLANDKINFELQRQEIHCLLGENGAGKTTLMNIIYGLYQQDEGEIFLNNSPVVIKSPNDAMRLGIGMVHQHFMLVPVMTVTENIMLGNEKTRGIKIGQLSKLDREKVNQEIREIAAQHDLKVNPEAVVQDLSVGEAQRVEILKMLYKGAQILILDEPTAVLTPQETDELFAIMRSLIKEGKTIIFITHKLKEVLAVADRITVLRNVKVVGTTSPEKTSMEELANMMVGREVILSVTKKPVRPAEQVLELNDLHVSDNRKIEAVRGISINIRAGEIYGIAGVQGNGQKEFIEALTGLRKVTTGKVLLRGKDVTNANTRSLINTGLGHIPEDRQKYGLILGFSVEDNLILQTYYKTPFSNHGLINTLAIHKNANRLVKEFDVRTPSISVQVSNLSGGNQQKVIVARELSRPLDLLIINQPTRGLDVGSIEFIHNRIIQARDKGAAVLLVSAELDEILSLSDRIGVMYRGQIVVEMDVKNADRETLGFYMAGLSKK